ncbi:MAG: MarR family transcriptional regulator [Huintestinicola sp.]
MSNADRNKELKFKIEDVIRRSYYSSVSGEFEVYMRGECKVLSYILNENRNDILPGEIAAGLEMTGGRIAGILRTLESKGYIVRRSDDEDRRRVLVSLTDNGRNYISSMMKRVDLLFEEFIERLGCEQTEAFINGFRCLSDVCEEMNNKMKNK